MYIKGSLKNENVKINDSEKIKCSVYYAFMDKTFGLKRGKNRFNLDLNKVIAFGLLIQLFSLPGLM